MNILQALHDNKLFAPHMGDLGTWAAWECFLAAIFGQDIPDQQLYADCTGREKAPQRAVKEAWMVVGRRGGKSRITALIATYLACFHDYRPYLSPGEVGAVMIIATDRRQAQVIMRYVQAFITSTPMLSALIKKLNAESIELTSNIVIQVTSCNLRAPRGHTIVAGLCDEIAYWRSDNSANPDSEILTALRPAMSTIPNAMLLCLSSPYARRGAMYEAYKQYYGQNADDVLVWQAPTWVMNPLIDVKFLDREKRKDPISFAAEYGADFRSDITAALDPDWIEAVLSLPNLDAPKSPHPRTYVAFVDMSGGRSDAACMAVAHTEPDQPHVLVDALRRFKPPFSPEGVVRQMCELAKVYGVRAVIGDNYSAELVVELFSKQGIGYRRSSESASDIYLQSLPLFSTAKLQAPDSPILRTELTALERRTRTNGKDLITHPPGQHDDLANAVCGAAFNAWRFRTNSELVIFASESTLHRDYVTLTDEPVPDPWRYL